MIEIKNIKKSYGNLEVLKGINLTIPENKIITIVGASGAGKSTLLHILGTLDSPDCGEIWYDRENIATYSQNKLSSFRNNNIGFVFQFHHLLPEFTALENRNKQKRSRAKSPETIEPSGITRKNFS